MSWGTAKQYISGPKAELELKYKDNSIWNNQDWYFKIRADIENTIARRCIELGVPVEDKSEPIGRELMILLAIVMLQMETVKEQVTAICYRAAIVCTFLAVGRGGEVGMSSFDLAHWNTVYCCLFMDWQELKTNAQKPMNFFCDRECFEIDLYHALCCYFIVGAGSQWIQSEPLDKRWIFPFVRSDTASKITTYLRKLASKVPGVPLDVTSTALRVGGVQEVVNRTDIVVGTIRGGWGGFLASVATIMEYYMQTHETLSKGGRAVSGWPQPEKQVHPPDCELRISESIAHQH